MRLEQTFVDAARQYPSVPAVVDRDDHRTYGELHDQAAAVAGALVRLAAGSLDRVGIFMDRGADAYVGVLAALLAGAAYVPINPAHPAKRVIRTLELAEVDAIVADAAGLAALSRVADQVRLPAILTPNLARAGIATAGRELVAAGDQVHECTAPPDGDDNMAYLLFTSGSTGEPKGVPITHRNVMSFLTENGQHYGFGPEDRCSQTFDLTFDLSVFDLFMAWQAGACLYSMHGTELLAPIEFVRDRQLTVWFSVPSVATLLIQRGGLSPNTMPTLRHSLFCGEALTVEIAEAWAEAAPQSVIENLYGPTELTIACSRYRWSDRRSAGEARNGIVPIGRPFPAMEHLVIGPDGNSVTGDQPGELCVAGPQQFCGYWRNPAKTGERTITIDGRDYYRTGDRVTTDGQTLHFVGRTDNQVQVLGHRVELGEVEAALRAVDGVVNAVAYGLPTDSATVTHIGAAVTLVHGSNHDRRTVRRAVADQLADYKRPRLVEIWDRFPLNTNGKIDRRAVATRSELELAR